MRKLPGVMEIFLYLDLGGGYISVYTFQKQRNCIPNICEFYCMLFIPQFFKNVTYMQIH